MRTFRVLIVCAITCSMAASAQSLGELAQQQKKASTTQSKARHVITNEDLSSSSLSPTTASPARRKPDGKLEDETGSDDPSSEELQARIKAQKKRIAQIEASIKDLHQQMDVWKTSDCTHVLYADTQRNACDEPQRLTAEYERAKAQLRTEQNGLQDMQEQARHLGYSTRVSDPN